MSLTLQELVEVVLVEVDPLHVVEVADAVRHPVLRDDDGQGGTVLRLDPWGGRIQLKCFGMKKQL